MTLARMRSVFGMLLLAVLPVSAQADDGGIVQLERFVVSASSASGYFEQSVTSPSGRRPQFSSGRFVFHRPGRFYWEYEKPYPQLLVSDGDKLWSWDPDLNQVTVQPIGDALGSTPAAILAGDGALERNFTLIDGGQRDGLAWVTAEPRERDSPFDLIRIGLSDNMLRRMEMRDQFGQITVIDFPDLDTGVNPDPALFRFEPPEGADVLGR
jgi:outer membrane lipoprotein carrier protein